MCVQDIKNDEIHMVRFITSDDVLSFVNKISEKIPCDVNAMYENQIVDAKSLLGMLGMPKHNIRVYAVTNDNKIQNIFNEICESYAVRNGGTRQWL